MPKGVVVITGPTATGKTKLGIELAKKFGGEVISADSMQLYKYMDIGPPCAGPPGGWTATLPGRSPAGMG